MLWQTPCHDVVYKKKKKRTITVEMMRPCSKFHAFSKIHAFRFSRLPSLLFLLLLPSQ